MTIKITNAKKIELEDKRVKAFYKTDITSFGNGAKIDCKKEFLNKGFKAYVVIYSG